MNVSNTLLKLITCPMTGTALEYDKENQELISVAAGLAYPIVDGIPILLVEQARRIRKLTYINAEDTLNPSAVKANIEEEELA